MSRAQIFEHLGQQGDRLLSTDRLEIINVPDPRTIRDPPRSPNGHSIQILIMLKDNFVIAGQV